MSDSLFPEYALRELWRRQQFSRGQLRTMDGRPVVVLSPGNPNDDGGPDFTDARIRIGGTTYVGDVELHVDAAAWHEHRHAKDAHYNRVILHVALDADSATPAARTATRRILPLLVLRPFLDPVSLQALEAGLLELAQTRQHVTPCRANGNGPVSLPLGQYLDRLAGERMNMKAWRFGERLKQLVDEREHVVREPYPHYYGMLEGLPSPQREYTPSDFLSPSLWNQLLYEGIMEALGYEKNRAPFLRLARTVTLDMLRSSGLDDTHTTMALLFGVAGLLPSSQLCSDTESRRYLQTLRHHWKSLQLSYRGPRLHESDWIFFRLRPANFPTVRLASVCFLLPELFHYGGMVELISAFHASTSAARLHLLRDLCSCSVDDFWSRHYHFHKYTSRRVTGLGRARSDQIILNVFIPIALLYSRTLGSTALQESALQVLSALPSEQDHWIIRTMRQRLAVDRVMVGSAKRQQGVMELYGRYCKKGKCEECPIARK